MVGTVEQTARKLAAKCPILRSRDFERHGVSRRYLPELVATGLWRKTARGIYVFTKRPPGVHQSLVEVSLQAPRAVVCLLSALRFHELTSETPSEVWLALPRGVRTPRVASVRVQAIRMSAASLSAGVEEHQLDGVTVRVFSAAKTVADCFKFRNRIGISVAMEALQDAWRSRKATADELWRHARVCRVANVIRPYLEAIAR